MFVYQQKENDKICVQFNTPQIPVETPDIVIEKDEEGNLVISVAGETVYTKALDTEEEDEG